MHRDIKVSCFIFLFNLVNKYLNQAAVRVCLFMCGFCHLSSADFGLKFLCFCLTRRVFVSVREPTSCWQTTATSNWVRVRLLPPLPFFCGFTPPSSLTCLLFSLLSWLRRVRTDHSDSGEKKVLHRNAILVRLFFLHPFPKYLMEGCMLVQWGCEIQHPTAGGAL